MARPAGFTFGLVRLRIDPANGTLDGTFGEGGTLITDVYNNWGGGMTIQGDGDIVVVGSENGDAFLTARYRGADGGQRLYYQQDANWNVTALVSADDASESYTGGAVVERYLTDPYGNVKVLDGNWWGRISDESELSYYGNVYFHQGGRYDATSGLYDFRNRSFSPVLGRWTEEDPAGYVDGMNEYEYVRSCPVGILDPEGRDSQVLYQIGGTGAGDAVVRFGSNGEALYLSWSTSTLTRPKDPFQGRGGGNSVTLPLANVTFSIRPFIGPPPAEASIVWYQTVHIILPENMSTCLAFRPADCR